MLGQLRRHRSGLAVGMLGIPKLGGNFDISRPKFGRTYTTGQLSLSLFSNGNLEKGKLEFSIISIIHTCTHQDTIMFEFLL